MPVDGFPGFELDGDHILAVKLIPTARNLLYQLESFMKSSGTQVFSMTRHVDNGYIHVSSSGGIKHAYIYAAEKNVDPEPELEGIEILSGIVKEGKIVNIVPPVLGSQPYEILREYKPTKQAVKYPLKGKGSDASFNDEKRLAVRVEAGVDPDSIENALSLSQNVEQRIKFQYEIQKFVDMSISSTVNLPPWGTKHNNEDLVIEFAATLAKYAPGLRGMTCYPDGSRGGQPLVSVPYAEAIHHKGVTYSEHDICEIGGKGGTCSS